MANTLNFGAGKWAAKAGSVLAYNDLNNNFKPLPFTFTRASSATRVNESGLIESVASGIPRIDYLNNADGHLLLEPSRTNLALYGTQISSYTGARLTRTDNQSVSPDGSVNAASIIPSSTSGTHYFYSDASITSGQTTTISFFVKENGYSKLKFLFTEVTNGVYAGQEVWFDIAEGSVGTKAASITASVENYGNGWYRCIASTVAVGTGTGRHYFGFGNNTETSSFAGDNTSGFYGYGVQIELGSYATSYIPTSGSSVTRVAESNTTQGSVPSSVIGQTEGVVYAEFKIDKAPAGTQRVIILSDGTANERIGISMGANSLYAFVVDGGSSQCEITKSSFTSGTHKVAFGYKTNDFVLYLNGTQVGTDSSGSVAVCNRIDLGNQLGTSTIEGAIKDVKLYNTRLSNPELAALTSL